jgi:hypothetical protein
MATQPYFIGIDWLQMFGVLGVDFQEGQHGIFTAKKEEYQTRHFKELYTIYLGVDEVATLQACPHSKIIDTGNSIVKLHNKYLYQQDLQLFTNNLLKCLGFKFVSISRIDLNIDFEVFQNGYKVSNFLNDFTRGNIIKHGKNKFKLQGTQSEILEYDYLRFGSATSNISTYIYNKSKELREVKNKPWIIDTWKANGLNNEVDVYRLEFSIKKMNKNAVNEDDGTFIQMNDLSMILRNNFESIIKYLIHKIWRFTKKKDRAKRKELNKCPTIEFFKFGTQNISLQRVSEKIESNRLDKVFIKKLENLANDYGTTNPYFIHELDTIGAYFRRTRGLQLYRI